MCRFLVIGATVHTEQPAYVEQVAGNGPLHSSACGCWQDGRGQARRHRFSRVSGGGAAVPQTAARVPDCRRGRQLICLHEAAQGKDSSGAHFKARVGQKRGKIVREVVDQRRRRVLVRVSESCCRRRCERCLCGCGDCLRGRCLVYVTTTIVTSTRCMSA